jgi:hypothetical protein
MYAAVGSGLVSFRDFYEFLDESIVRAMPLALGPGHQVLIPQAGWPLPLQQTVTPSVVAIVLIWPCLTALSR